MFIRGPLPPPSTFYKNSKNRERTLVWWAKIKTRTLSKNIKIEHQKYVYQGSPPPPWECEIHSQMMTSVYSIWYIDFDRRKERMLFWWAKIKTRTLSKNVKIDPQKPYTAVLNYRCRNALVIHGGIKLQEKNPNKGH